MGYIFFAYIIRTKVPIKFVFNCTSFRKPIKPIKLYDVFSAISLSFQGQVIGNATAQNENTY